MNRTAIKIITAGAATFSVSAALATGNAGAATRREEAQPPEVIHNWRAAPAPAVPPGNEAMRLVKAYSDFAGSYKNATSLVIGLRTGNTITLSDNGDSASGTTTGGIVQFMPPDQGMGWGNVRHTLSLARAELATQGIVDPTPDQIQSALTGGTVTGANGSATTLPGILTLRSQGMGWGEISHRLGVTPNGHLIPTTVTPPFHYSGHRGVVVSAAGARIDNAHGHGLAPPDGEHRASGGSMGVGQVTTASGGGLMKAGLSIDGKAEAHGVASAGGNGHGGSGLGIGAHR